MASLLLSGCANKNFLKQGTDLNSLSPYGIVVVRGFSTNPGPLCIGIIELGECSPSVRWHLVEGGLISMKNRDKSFSSYDDEMHAYLVKPGRYSLESASTLGSSKIMSPLGRMGDAVPPREIAYFIIEPGELVYLGDIAVHNIPNYFSFSLHDNFDEAKFYIETEYPTLNIPLEKRLMTVFEDARASSIFVRQ